MKKLTVLFWIFFCLNSFSAEPYGSWIESQEGKYFCTEIRIHAHKARFIMPNGEKMSIPLNRINSYSLNGCEFYRLPLYENGKITNHMVFMELVCRSKECALYRYGHCKIKCVQSTGGVSNYYIYKGKNLHMASDCIGLPQACRYDLNKQRYK
jgi:hypothetical protein